MTETGIEFLATLPETQSAIKIGGDGARIQLDVPESELGAMLGLIAWRGKVLRVKIEAESWDEAIGAF